jgi:hypothetical protein
LLVEGVLNGSNGAIYYPAQEISKSAQYWNGKPVVVYHPDMTGGGSAAIPDVFNRQKIGVLFNTRTEGPRLLADAWIDVERARQVDSRILSAIQAKIMMELSTGLFMDTNPSRGWSNGVDYNFVGSNFRPDHLALLPDMIGACSISDGAGFIRNERDVPEQPLVMPRMFFVPIDNRGKRTRSISKKRTEADGRANKNRQKTGEEK